MLVDDAIRLRDGTREVKLYHAPNTHSPGMLVGYVPDARVLFTADLISDTFPLNPVFASPVHKLIRENGLSVEMIASGHGNVMPYADLPMYSGCWAGRTSVYCGGCEVRRKTTSKFVAQSAQAHGKN